MRKTEVSQKTGTVSWKASQYNPVQYYVFQLSLARFVQLLFVTEREQIVLQIKTSSLLGPIS